MRFMAFVKMAEDIGDAPPALVEAMDALDAGRDVMVFSDNVPLEQELVLKRTAAERGLDAVSGVVVGHVPVEQVALPR